MDGKHTTHATTVVAFKNGYSFGPSPESITHGDHSTRKRSLELPIPQQVTLECRAQGKRPSEECRAQGKRPHEVVFINTITQRSRCDFAWCLLRLGDDKCLQSAALASDDLQQTVPGWHAFNAKVSTGSAIQTSVGYCSTISGSMAK